jgi:metal-responsive CopG/Arc/MetJ family transcriptional regulator
MANITVSVDDNLKQQMDRHPEINWSEVARQAFQEKLEDLELMEKIASKSQLTEEDVEELSEKIDEDVADRLVRE